MVVREHILIELIKGAEGKMKLVLFVFMFYSLELVGIYKQPVREQTQVKVIGFVWL